MISGSGSKAILDVRDRLEGPTECPAVVGMPYPMSGSGREALQDVRDLSGGPP